MQCTIHNVHVACGMEHFCDAPATVTLTRVRDPRAAVRPSPTGDYSHQTQTAGLLRLRRRFLIPFRCAVLSKAPSGQIQSKLEKKKFQKPFPLPPSTTHPAPNPPPAFHQIERRLPRVCPPPAASDAGVLRLRGQRPRRRLPGRHHRVAAGRDGVPVGPAGPGAAPQDLPGQHDPRLVLPPPPRPLRAHRRHRAQEHPCPRRRGPAGAGGRGDGGGGR